MVGGRQWKLWVKSMSRHTLDQQLQQLPHTQASFCYSPPLVQAVRSHQEEELALRVGQELDCARRVVAHSLAQRNCLAAGGWPCGDLTRRMLVCTAGEAGWPGSGEGTQPPVQVHAALTPVPPSPPCPPARPSRAASPG